MRRDGRTAASRRRRIGPVAAALAVLLALAVGCQAAPLANPQGTQPGLAATPAADRSRARAVIARVGVAGRGPRTGYDRDRFGPAWSDDVAVAFGHNGCDTRNDVLRRDLDGPVARPGTRGCVIVSGQLADPYTGRVLPFAKAQASKVQIDHVVPLSYAWQLGASRWSTAKRKQFANDPINLLAVDGPTNQRKGDSGPASWLPPNKAIRCSYAVRFALVAYRYGLPVTRADKDLMTAQCTSR